MAGSLDGRVAVVTGAAGGLGEVFCVALAKAGAAVAGVDIASLGRTAAAVEAASGRFLGVNADITTEAGCGDVFDQVTRELGAASILVNNAGRYPVIPFAETTFQQWRNVHSLNVDAVFLMTKRFLPGMIDAGWGRVVNIASAVVFLGPPGMVAYTASKSALVGFTRALASEVGPSGVTVNVIAPGLTRTATALTTSVNEQFPYVVGHQAVPRAEEPADLVSTLLYVCDPGSAFLTGQAINVDGGFAKH
jgi:3-oxoacyl-[acyl-carrier protein] reductase